MWTGKAKRKFWSCGPTHLWDGKGLPRTWVDLRGGSGERECCGLGGGGTLLGGGLGSQWLAWVLRPNFLPTDPPLIHTVTVAFNITAFATCVNNISQTFCVKILFTVIVVGFKISWLF